MATTIAELLVEIGVKVEGAKKAEKELDEIGKEGKQAGKKTEEGAKKAKKGLDQLRAMAGRVRKALKKAQKAGAALGKGISAIGGVGKVAFAAVAVAAAGLGKVLLDTTAKLDRIGKESKKFGLSTDEFQLLEFAAGQSGTTIEAVGKGLKDFRKRLEETRARGTGPVKDALEDLGLEAERFDKGPIQTLKTFATELEKIKDPAERVQLSMKAFGEEAGPEMVKALEQGPEAFQAYIDRANELGIVNEEQIEKAEAFQDQMGELSLIFQTVSADLIENLLPVVEQGIIDFQAWRDENEELISQDLPAFLGGLVEAIVTVVSAVVNVKQNFLDLRTELEQLIERVETDFPNAFAVAGAAVSAVTFPIRTVFNLISGLVQKLVEFAKKSETILGLLRAAGLVEEEPTTKVRGVAGIPKPGETPGQARARQAQETKDKEQQAKNEKAQSRREARERKKSERTQARRDSADVAEIVGKARTKKRRFSATERDRLKALGRTDEQINALQRRARGAGAGKGKKKKEEKESDVTLGQALLAVKTGTADPKQLKKVIKALAKKTPSTKSIKPTVAIDFFNFQITQNFKGGDPAKVGKASADAIRKEFQKATAKAGQTISGTVVR